MVSARRNDTSAPSAWWIPLQELGFNGLRLMPCCTLVHSLVVGGREEEGGVVIVIGGVDPVDKRVSGQVSRRVARWMSGA